MYEYDLLPFTGLDIKIVCMFSFYIFHLDRVLELNKENCQEKSKDIGLLVCVMVYTVDKIIIISLLF